MPTKIKNTIPSIIKVVVLFAPAKELSGVAVGVLVGISIGSTVGVEETLFIGDGEGGGEDVTCCVAFTLALVEVSARANTFI